jgi:hypothetical protein
MPKMSRSRAAARGVREVGPPYLKLIVGVVDVLPQPCKSALQC